MESLGWMTTDPDLKKIANRGLDRMVYLGKFMVVNDTFPFWAQRETS